MRGVKRKLYDDIEAIENSIEEVETRLYNIKQEKISSDNVYQFLLFFDKLYDRFADIEKKTFLKSFLDSVYIYEEAKEDGRILQNLIGTTKVPLRQYAYCPNFTKRSIM